MKVLIFNEPKGYRSIIADSFLGYDNIIEFISSALDYAGSKDGSVWYPQNLSAIVPHLNKPLKFIENGQVFRGNSKDNDAYDNLEWLRNQPLDYSCTSKSMSIIYDKDFALIKFHNV